MPEMAPKDDPLTARSAPARLRLVFRANVRLTVSLAVIPFPFQCDMLLPCRAVSLPAASCLISHRNGNGIRRALDLVFLRQRLLANLVVVVRHLASVRSLLVARVLLGFHVGFLSG